VQPAPVMPHQPGGSAVWLASLRGRHKD
jgi:hypothetical protein